MGEEFRVRIGVRGYELDVLGHVNQAVYLQYAEHARWECMRAAGISVDDMRASGVLPVVLETTIRYLRELGHGDEVDVTCGFIWGEGKTFQVVQRVQRADGTLSAEITGVGGLLDLDQRRLVADPAARWRALATSPGLLGL